MTNSIKKEQGSVNITIVNNIIKQEKFSTCLQKYTRIRLHDVNIKLQFNLQNYIHYTNLSTIRLFAVCKNI